MNTLCLPYCFLDYPTTLAKTSRTGTRNGSFSNESYRLLLPPFTQNASSVDSISVLAGDATWLPTSAPSTESSYTPAPTLAPVVPPIGNSLSSPPELEWELDGDNGVFTANVNFGVVAIDNFWGRTTTRGYNGAVRFESLGPNIVAADCTVAGVDELRLLEKNSSTFSFLPFDNPLEPCCITKAGKAGKRYSFTGYMLVYLTRRTPHQAHCWRLLPPLRTAGMYIYSLL